MVNFCNSIFFFKVWFNKRSNIELRLLVILIVSVLLLLHKHIKTPDQNEAIRNCSKHEFFTFDYIDTCEKIQSLETQLTINYFSLLKLNYKNLNYFSQLLLLLSGDISLSLGPVHQGTLQSSIEWIVFENNINSLLWKIEELYFSAKATNAPI